MIIKESERAVISGRRGVSVDGHPASSPSSVGTGRACLGRHLRRESMRDIFLLVCLSNLSYTSLVLYGEELLMNTDHVFNHFSVLDDLKLRNCNDVLPFSWVRNCFHNLL